MVQVTLERPHDLEKAIRLLKQKTQKAGITRELRIRRLNPSVRGRKRNKRYRALLRYQAQERRIAKAKESWQKEIQANRRG